MRYLIYKLSGALKACRDFFERQFTLIHFLREIESYKELHEKYSKQVVIVYHARCEMGPEAWLRVMERVKEKPTISRIVEDFNGDTKL